MAAVGFPYRGVAKKEGKTVTRSQPAEFVAEGGTEAFQKEREGRGVREEGERRERLIWEGETKIIGVGYGEREKGRVWRSGEQGKSGA